MVKSVHHGSEYTRNVCLSWLFSHQSIFCRCRLRKKTWKNPGTIYMNEQVYEDEIPIYPNWEVFLEVLEGGCFTSHGEKTRFCLCENKDADQRNCTADQHLCFPFGYTCSMMPRLFKSEISNCRLHWQVCVRPGRKPQKWFPSIADHTVVHLQMRRHMGKPTICICENTDADQLPFVFATRIVQFLFYLNPKFQASSSFL